MGGDHSEARRTALELARPLVDARTIILTGSAAGSRRMARFLTDAGARTVPIDLGTLPQDTRCRFAACERTLAEPPETLRRQISSADPEGSALVYAGSFTAFTKLCGRRVIGSRSARHRDAERKDTQLDLLGSPAQVVALTDGLALPRVPVVVQGIPDQGIAMATSHTYLVPRSASGRDIGELGAKLGLDCTRVIITTFNAGVPCTFYGFITASAVIDFGPVEALVYWDPRTWRIHAPGILWPLRRTAKVLASARSSVHAVARRLHERLGYTGAFGTDGVISDDGYIIHEINPRVCAGFSLLDQLIPEAAPLAAIDLVLRELPEVSGALAIPLKAVSSELEQRLAPTYRLWDSPDRQLPAPSDPAAQAQWAQQIRIQASDGRRPVIELTR